jgi:beta-lactamase superfamily II metal-dependent hydrolase
MSDRGRVDTVSRQSGAVAVHVQTITVGAFQENCYLVVDDRSRRAVIVDPGSEGERVVDAIESSGATLEAIWITHAHVDHVGAVASVKRKWDVPIYLHPLDRRLYEAASRQAEVYGLPFEEPPAPDQEFSDGQQLKVGDAEMTVTSLFTVAGSRWLATACSPDLSGGPICPSRTRRNWPHRSREYRRSLRRPLYIPVTAFRRR